MASLALAYAPQHCSAVDAVSGACAANLNDSLVARAGFDARMIEQWRVSLESCCAALQGQAVALAGRPFSMASSLQLAAVLYDDLALPPPTACTSR